MARIRGNEGVRRRGDADSPLLHRPGGCRQSLAPYTNWNADLPGEEILLNDDRVPDLTGRDSLHFSIPEDGLKGALDGVAGTFTCPEGYCSLATSWVGPGYIPWADSAPVLLRLMAQATSKSVRPTHLVSPSAEVPKVNYLSLGSWLYVPEVGADPDDFRFRHFRGRRRRLRGRQSPGPYRHRQLCRQGHRDVCGEIGYRHLQRGCGIYG